MVWTSESDSPSDAASRIAALEATVADLQRRLSALESAGLATNGRAAESAVSDAVDHWSVPPWPEIVRLLLDGRKINAIKLYREHFGGGLKEAKDVVDEAERRIRG